MANIKQIIKKRLLEILLFLMVVTLLLLAIAPSIVKIVKSGESGVLYRTLRGGTETAFGDTFGEGLHFILPWDKLFIYDVRIQEGNDLIQVITKDGLSINVEISVRYHPNTSTLGLLHKYVGPDYYLNVVKPEIESTVRDVIGVQDLDSLYSDKRVAIQREISDIALNEINNQNVLNNYETLSLRTNSDFDSTRIQEYIIFEDLFIKDIILPLAVKSKIEEKIVAEQEMLRYDYLIAAEEKEKIRKLIEAQGVKFFEDSSRISILKWRGLEATEKLAISENAKLIVIGTDENLPIILNGETNN